MMVWLIYLINFFAWLIAAAVIGGGTGMVAFGIMYFIIGYPLSLIVLQFSDNYAISYLDRFKHPPFTIWYRKMVWSNGIATAIIWGGLGLIALIYAFLE
jgi:hypothetical protein